MVDLASEPRELGSDMERARIGPGRPPKELVGRLDDHVVAVADALFVEKGYGATSIASIAARARVGKQTLYRRFPDKAALFREVIRRRIGAMALGQAGIVDTPDPLAELRKLGLGALDMVRDPEFLRLYRVIIAEAEPFPELACAASDNWGASFGDRCIEAVKQAQAMGLCRPGSPELLAQSFLWGLIGDALLRGLTNSAGPGCRAADENRLATIWSIFLESVAPTEIESARL